MRSPIASTRDNLTLVALNRLSPKNVGCGAQSLFNHLRAEAHVERTSRLILIWV
jgi:hypothetical protein